MTCFVRDTVPMNISFPEKIRGDRYLEVKADDHKTLFSSTHVEWSIAISAARTVEDVWRTSSPDEDVQ